MSYHYTPGRMAKIYGKFFWWLKTAGEDAEQQELSYIAGGNAK